MTPDLGFCACGCGQRTTISSTSSPSRGLVKGQPIRFVHGHNARKLHYVAEDRGYSSPCWIWQLAQSKDGHGRTQDGDRFRMAHIVYWEKVNGPVPPGILLHHECRVTPCVNPAHLTPMSHAEHQRLHMGKVGWPEVHAIRRLYAAGGVTYKTLSRRFGLSQGQLCAIVKGKAWVDEQVAA